MHSTAQLFLMALPRVTVWHPRAPLAPSSEITSEAVRSWPPVEAPTIQVPQEAPTIHGSGQTSSLCSTSVITWIGMNMKMLKVIAYPKVGVHFISKDFTATKPWLASIINVPHPCREMTFLTWMHFAISLVSRCRCAQIWCTVERILWR